MHILSRQLVQPLSDRQRAERFSAIRRDVLADSQHLTGGNFRQIGEEDLALLLQLYDRTFFAGRLQHLMDGRLHLRLSSRLTSAAGKTYERSHRDRKGRRGPAHIEIAISTHLLFHNFCAEEKPVHVNGVPCRDRLDALQRVFEHELLHLVELLLYGHSSCRAARFRDLARHLFGHTDVTHRLATVRDTARHALGLQIGASVRFTYRGSIRTGILNRITKRATVLVPAPDGEPYSDGNRYHKYYVPIEALQPV